MNKILILLIIPFLAISQEESTKPLYPFSFGAGVYTKVSTNAVVQPRARKTEFTINTIPDFYLNTYLPYSTKNDIGIYLEAGFNYHQFVTENVDAGEKYTASLNYFSISPYLYLENFLLGFSVGIPFAADYGLPAGASLPNPDVDEVERLNNLFEIKLGYVLSLFEDYNGRLNLNFMAAYSFNGVFDSYPKNDPYGELITPQEDYPVTRVFNPRIASINIGVSYFFYLGL